MLVFNGMLTFEFQYNLSGRKYVGEEPETGVSFYYYYDCAGDECLKMSVRVIRTKKKRYDSKKHIR